MSTSPNFVRRARVLAVDVWSEAGELLSPAARFWSGGWLRGHAKGVAVALVALTVALVVATGAIHARIYGHDIFFLLDNGWRALHGQRVHVDYSSAWGPVTFLLMAAGLGLSGGSVASVSYANALAAAVTGLWAAWLAAGRSRSLSAVAFPAFIALLAAAPFALGDNPLLTSHGMVYNRYGYALLAIIMLECFLPAAGGPPTRARRFGETVLTGCATALLLFLKVTYFIVALPILGMSLLLCAPRRSRTLGYVIGFASTTFLFLAYLRFDLSAMATDLYAAGAARSGSLGAGLGFTTLAGNAVIHALPLGLLAFGCSRISGNAELRTGHGWGAYRYVFAALTVAGADTLLLYTNAQAPVFPLTAAFAVLLLYLIEPDLMPASPPALRSAASPLVVLAVLLSGPTLILQGAGLIYALVEARLKPNPQGVLRFESPRLHPLVLYDAAPGDVDRYSNGREYVASLNDGIRLLAAHSLPEEKVATLDMFNPFAYAMARQPPRGGIAAAAYRYTLDDRNHPSPARFFGDAAILMVPKFPASPPVFYDGYRRIYQPAIDREFRLQAESSRWRLYRRVTPSVPIPAVQPRSAGVY